MTKKNAAGLALLGVIILAAYFINQHISISWLDAQSASPSINTASLPDFNQPGQGKIWVCPMHPEIMQDHPGTCPICGMELVESKDHTGHDHGVHIDSASVQKLGVRLARVKKSMLAQEVLSYGNVTADGTTLYNVHSYFDGWIKKSYIHSLGQHIAKGQVIYEFYSPDLIAQQKEYLRFVERRNQVLQTIGDARFQENEYVMDLLQELSRERTKFLRKDVGIETVEKLENSRQAIEVVKILAAESGVVTQINAREGNFVTPSVTLFTLSNTSRVWVEVALYPDQTSLVKNGDDVTIKNSAGQEINSKISFLNSVADNNKVSARIALDNSKLHLRPGNFVDVNIRAQAHEALVLPRSAVMVTGQGNMVMLSQGAGHFLPLHVETGSESGDWIEISDGLQEGAEVAVNGQFLLDSAANLHAAAERMHTHKP